MFKVTSLKSGISRWRSHLHPVAMIVVMHRSGALKKSVSILYKLTPHFLTCFFSIHILQVPDQICIHVAIIPCKTLISFYITNDHGAMITSICIFESLHRHFTFSPKFAFTYWNCCVLVTFRFSRTPHEINSQYLRHLTALHKMQYYLRISYTLLYTNLM